MPAVSLPLELLQEIAKYLIDDHASLFNAALVSRSWARSFIDALWRQPHAEALLSPAIRSPRSGRRQFYTSKIKVFAFSRYQETKKAHCLEFPNLTSLTVLLGFDWKAIEGCLQHNLATLIYLTDREKDCDNEGDFINAIGVRCPELRYLSLDLNYHRCGPADLIALFEACTKLGTIELSWGQDVHEPDHDVVDFDVLLHLLSRQKHLKHLRLGDYWLRPKIAHRLLMALSSPFPHSKTSGSGGDSQPVTNSAHITTSLQTLHIGLAGDTEDSNSPSFSLIARLQNLTSLTVQFKGGRHNNDISGIIALRQLQNLEELYVWPAFEDIWLVATEEERISFFSAFPRLRICELVGFPEFTMTDLVALGQASRHLVKLRLPYRDSTYEINLFDLDQIEDVLFPELQGFDLGGLKPLDFESTR
ncbi:hypothetical protein K461DRAFT_47189 [Myriangium duriaei CBS 260.36]|uniref:F-box domain-containing protein n=1 Tax=Myriangium duriaei CBS 260.36 TaxID=1168546 RepID=A0A9P4MDS3_9PEZI|nr:hypothetical protein K461DRAFT_47189 [Myriangium duriaei CBS 260.36]